MSLAVALDRYTQEIKASVAHLNEAQNRLNVSMKKASHATVRFSEASFYPQRYRWGPNGRVPVRTPEDVVEYLTQERDDPHSHVTTAKSIAALLTRYTTPGAIEVVERARTVVSVFSWDPARERIRAFREGRVEFRPKRRYAWRTAGASYQLQWDRTLTEGIVSAYDVYRCRADHSINAAVKFLELIRAVDRPERLGSKPVLYEPASDAVRQARRMFPMVRNMRRIVDAHRSRCERLEWMRRHRRSLQVFEQHLTVEQLLEWRAERTVTVTTPAGRYCITPHPAYNVFRFSAEPAQYCAVPEYGQWPLGDVMLSQLLLLRHDSQLFFAIANKRFLYYPAEHQMVSPEWLQSRRQLVTGTP